MLTQVSIPGYNAHQGEHYYLKSRRDAEVTDRNAQSALGGTMPVCLLASDISYHGAFIEHQADS